MRSSIPGMESGSEIRKTMRQSHKRGGDGTRIYFTVLNLVFANAPPPTFGAPSPVRSPLGTPSFGADLGKLGFDGDDGIASSDLRPLTSPFRGLSSFVAPFNGALSGDPFSPLTTTVSLPFDPAPSAVLSLDSRPS